MKNTRNIFAAAVVVVTLIGAGFLLSRSAVSPGPCSVISEAPLPEIPEASGLAVSRRHAGIIWSHNDSGNVAVLFALDRSGAVRGRVRVPIDARDWEDVSAAPCPSGDCLYIADIGDNSGVRRSIRVYRVPEPALDDAQAAALEMFDLVYPDGPHNAEALFMADGYAFVVPRQTETALYRSAEPLHRPGEIRLQHIGQLSLVGVSDAEASPDGGSVVVRTSDDVAFYRTADLKRGGMVAPFLQLSIAALREPQGEGVALDANGVLYLASEGGRWGPAGRLIALRCRVQP